MRTDGRTDITDVVGAIREYANAPDNGLRIVQNPCEVLLHCCYVFYLHRMMALNR